MLDLPVERGAVKPAKLDGACLSPTWTYGLDFRGLPVPGRRTSAAVTVYGAEAAAYLRAPFPLRDFRAILGERSDFSGEAELSGTGGAGALPPAGCNRL